MSSSVSVYRPHWGGRERFWAAVWWGRVGTYQLRLIHAENEWVMITRKRRWDSLWDEVWQICWLKSTIILKVLTVNQQRVAWIDLNIGLRFLRGPSEITLPFMCMHISVLFSSRKTNGSKGCIDIFVNWTALLEEDAKRLVAVVFRRQKPSKDKENWSLTRRFQRFPQTFC